MIADTLRLYWRFPLLFLILAAVVVVPYELIALAATGTGSLSRSNLSFPVSQLLFITHLALVGPLVSAMHVHAVADVREGERPHFGKVARRGLAALPVVAVATLAAWLGFVAGLLLFVVPGIVLYLRWFVAAQAAAIERRGWNRALTESHDLVAGHYRHVAILAGVVLLISSAPMLLLGLAIGHSTSALTVTAGICVQVIVWSFSALVTALLYFDLVARRPRARPAEAGESPALVSADAGLGAASGWRVDPDNPKRMRYWDAESSVWRGSTRTPRSILRSYREQADDD